MKLTNCIMMPNETNWIVTVGIRTRDLQLQSPTLYHDWAKETCPTSWTSRNVVKFRYIALPLRQLVGQKALDSIGEDLFTFANLQENPFVTLHFRPWNSWETPGF
jgi:hypothetical protein